LHEIDSSVPICIRLRLVNNINNTTMATTTTNNKNSIKGPVN
ncbi:MAG: hypothetical protein ACI8RD_004896, partial [Bacillariaceae sp.]